MQGYVSSSAKESKLCGLQIIRAFQIRDAWQYNATIFCLHLQVISRSTVNHDYNGFYNLRRLVIKYRSSLRPDDAKLKIVFHTFYHSSTGKFKLYCLECCFTVYHWPLYLLYHGEAVKPPSGAHADIARLHIQYFGRKLPSSHTFRRVHIAPRSRYLTLRASSHCLAHPQENNVFQSQTELSWE